ncbi:MAG: threonine/serine dehydratase [Acidimicrobiia bacterium]|jgi:threonine dehydratase|nr:threonine/serine dehydratase [Acidimicrobiia bacterium]
MLPLGLSDVQAARPLVAPRVHRTPLVASRTLSERLGIRVSLKLEVFQKTGSFKPRGAFNQLLHLDPEQRSRGVVGVSGGNFAQGLAYAGRELGVPVTIIVPEGTPAHYIAATRGYGAEVESAPSIAEAFFRADAYRAAGKASLHPFDDPRMMAGNGTLGLEVVEDAPDLTDLFVSIGGGGLMAGVAAAVKGLRPGARVWGVETLGCHAMRLALDLGRPVEMKPTSIAKTLAAPWVSAGTLAAAQAWLEDVLVVPDAAAVAALVLLLERAKVLTEPAASCTLAAAEAVRGRLGEHVVLVLCGGNAVLSDVAAWRERYGV